MAKILVVDDSPVIRHFLIALLDSGDHDVLEASDGAIALEIVHAERPDLIISDILMPIMDGVEFTRRLRADSSIGDTPVIFHTATYREPQAKALAAACRVRTVIPKPSDARTILDAVSKELGGAPSGDIPLLSTETKPENAPRNLDDKLASYVQEMNLVKVMFDKLAAKFSGLIDEGEALSEASSKFSANLSHLQRFGSRLAMIIETTLEMSPEQGAELVLRRFFDAACAIIGSHYAAIAVYTAEKGKLAYVFAKGFDANVYLTASRESVTALEALIAQNPTGYKRLTTADRDIDGFPDGHPAVRSFLGAMIASRGHVRGWMYFAERHGRAEFSDEDERVVATLAAHVAVFYESAKAYDLLQQHATNLQMEIVRRDQGEIEAR